MSPIEQGRTAAEVGRQKEELTRTYLNGAGYNEATGSQYKHLRIHLKTGRTIQDWFHSQEKDKLYVQGMRTAKNIYGIPWAVDVTLFDMTRFQRCLFIEVKTQTVGGSVDEKLPFIILSLKAIGERTGFLICGDGFREAAIQWAIDQQTDHFKVWRNDAKMRDYILGKKGKNHEIESNTAQVELFNQGG